jgi:hypothetical protein
MDSIIRRFGYGEIISKKVKHGETFQFIRMKLVVEKIWTIYFIL